MPQSSTTDTTLSDFSNFFVERERELTGNLINNSNTRLCDVTVVSSPDDLNSTFHHHTTVISIKNDKAASQTNFSNLSMQNSKSFLTLKPIFAEPLFTGIEYETPASENYMMIEPLFSEFLDSLETEKALPSSEPQSNKSKCIERLNEESGSTKLDCVTCGTSNIFNKNIAIDNDIDELFVVDIGEPNHSVVSSVKASVVSNNDSDNVTILPEAVTSFSHCLRLVSARSKRLRGLCNTAIWRSIKILAAWICVILFVFWLASFFSLSTFPENPLKFFLNEKKTNKKKNRQRRTKKITKEKKRSPTPQHLL